MKHREETGLCRLPVQRTCSLNMQEGHAAWRLRERKREREREKCLRTTRIRGRHAVAENPTVI